MTMRQYIDLGKDHRARMNDAAGDRQPSRKFLDASTVTVTVFLELLRTRSRILRSEREVESNTLTFQHINCFQ